MKAKWIFALALLAGSVSHAEKKPKNDMESFWENYRHQFLSKKYDKLAKMTSFPVNVKGTLDDDPIFEVQSKKFKSCFAHIYDKDVGMSAQEQSHFDYISKNPFIPKNAADSDSSFRVGDLQFEKKANGFQLTRLYLDTNDSEVERDCK